MLESQTPVSDRQTYWLRVAGLCFLLLFGFWLIKGFVAALIWGLVIAIAIDPLHMRLRQSWPGSGRHTLLAFLLTLGFALIVLVPLVLGIAQAAIEARQVASWILAAKSQGIPPPQWISHIPFAAPVLSEWWSQHLSSPEAATAQLNYFVSADMLTRTRLIGSNVLHRVVIFAFTLLSLFFLLRDRDSIIAQLRRAGDRLLGPASERIGFQAVQSVRGTIDGLVLVGIGEGVVMTIAYLILGVPHPLLLGVLTAIAATIPFGAAFMFVVAALLLLGVGSVSGAIIVIVFGLIVVGVADHFVRPALIGGATRLPFLWVLVGILGGAETLGILGLFVGPATMAVLVMLWRDLTDNRTPVATEGGTPLPEGSMNS
jgi:predicted PurR-regulated permease PerM